MALTSVRVTLLLLASVTLSSEATAQLSSSSVHAATIENITIVADRSSVHVKIRNVGAQPITAFSIVFFRLDANNEHVPCGGRGMDMIDWSDPMPGRGLYVRMHRNWVPPNGTLSLDGYPHCPSGSVPLESIQVELSLIMFDDGTGEGDPRQIESTLRLRQQTRNERLKWIGRLTALRSTSELKTAAQSLYQDMVDAARAAEINPDDASRQGMAKPAREELQNLALEITQWAAHNEMLRKNELLEWRITDIEQRTARLIRGSGLTDVRPY